MSSVSSPQLNYVKLTIAVVGWWWQSFPTPNSTWTIWDIFVPKKYTLYCRAQHTEPKVILVSMHRSLLLKVECDDGVCSRFAELWSVVSLLLYYTIIPWCCICFHSPTSCGWEASPCKVLSSELQIQWCIRTHFCSSLQLNIFHLLKKFEVSWNLNFNSIVHQYKLFNDNLSTI